MRQKRVGGGSEKSSSAEKQYRGVGGGHHLTFCLVDERKVIKLMRRQVEGETPNEEG